MGSWVGSSLVPRVLSLGWVRENPGNEVGSALSLNYLGSFSNVNDDGDGKEDVKKAIGLSRNTTTLHVHHAFLYISLPPVHDKEVKMPNCKFYGGKKRLLE